MSEIKERLIDHLDKMNKQYDNLGKLAPLLSRRDKEGWKLAMGFLKQQTEDAKELIINEKVIPSININFRKLLNPFTKKHLGINANDIPIGSASGQIKKSWLKRRGINKEDLKRGDFFLHI